MQQARGGSRSAARDVHGGCCCIRGISGSDGSQRGCVHAVFSQAKERAEEAAESAVCRLMGERLSFWLLGFLLFFFYFTPKIVFLMMSHE